MKQLILGPIVFALCLCLITSTMSCTVGDGNGKPPIADTTPGPKHSDYRFELRDSNGKTTIADGLWYRDTTFTPNGGSPMTARALDYICPCGRTGTLMPPYTVDTITYPEGSRRSEDTDAVIRELPQH